MGEDARWVCHTCKTVCPRGGRPELREFNTSIRRLARLRLLLADLDPIVDIDGLKDHLIPFIDDLQRWLGRHKDHDIHIGSDYSTDMMDLENYHNETVDGKVDKRTRIECQLQAVNEIEAESIERIKKVIEEYAVNPGEISLEKVAKDLYYRFSSREM